MGNFLFLFLFASLNIALGWGMARWLVRREQTVGLASNDEALADATTATLKPAAALAAPVIKPAASAPAPPAPAQESATPATRQPEPEPAVNAPRLQADDFDPAADADEAQEDTSTLSYEEIIGRVATECPLTDAIGGVLKLEVEQFRSALLNAEATFRHSGDDVDGMQSALQNVKSLIGGWLADQTAAREHLESAKSKLDIFSIMNLPIDELLIMATSRLDSRCRQVQGEDANLPECAAKIRRELNGLIDACHDLRDSIQNGFAAVVRQNQKFEYADTLLVDPLTGLANRAGLETGIVKWWKTESRQGDAASLAMVDVDGMAQINQQLGTSLSDKLLCEIGAVIRDELREERGYDVPARIGGQRFSVLLGFSTPRQAAAAMDRIRQAVEAATVNTPEGPCRLRISCVTTPLQKSASLAKHLEMLTAGLETAKERGGNCTVLSQDGENAHFESEPAEFTPRTITLTLDEDDPFARAAAAKAAAATDAATAVEEATKNEATNKEAANEDATAAAASCESEAEATAVETAEAAADESHDATAIEPNLDATLSDDAASETAAAAVTESEALDSVGEVRERETPAEETTLIASETTGEELASPDSAAPAVPASEGAYKVDAVPGEDILAELGDLVGEMDEVLGRTADTQATSNAEPAAAEVEQESLDVTETEADAELATGNVET